MTDRRKFLQAFGIGCTGTLLAGCSALSEDDADRADGEDGADDGSDGDDGNDGESTDGSDGESTDGDGGESTDGDDGSDIETGPYETEVIEMTAGGADLGPDYDEGHFYYAEVEGDFDVSVHALSIGGETGWEKSGLMVRESIDPEASHLMVRRNPSGDSVYDASPASVQWRTEAGENTSPGPGGMAEWLRLKREGDTFEVYGSMTGDNWEQFGTYSADEVPVGDTAVVGLAATGIDEFNDAAVTAAFKDLSGIEPTDNVDLGEPADAGDVTVRDDVAVASTAEPEMESAEATLAGKVFLPEGVEEADCYFEYRLNEADDWNATDSQTVSESTTITETVPVESRRIYQYRVIADVDGGAVLADRDTTDGSVAFRSAPSAGDSEADDTELSAGVAEFGPADGFADPAPWLDDDTPIIPIRELSADAFEPVLKTPHERLVVFETSGTVDLNAEKKWSIRRDKCYIAGQTAPSPGITFIRGGFQVAANDCVVQHIRVRPGIAGQEEGWAPTGLYTQDETRNNVIDHCTVTWALDENLTVGGYGSQDTTLTNNLAAEGLADATHPKGVHSYGSLIKDDGKNIAMMGNVWAHNLARNPRLKTGTESVIVNNVSYQYERAVRLDEDSVATIVGNVYWRPESTTRPNIAGGRVYHEDNVTDPEETEMVQNLAAELDARPLWPDGLEAMSGADTADHNLANAGARPADRTDHDQRIIDQVRDWTGELIDSEQEVGGYPDLEENTRELDVPDSGTHAWLREHSEAVENGA